ncbi:MAG: hypothetical protein H7Y36_07380 [Armatimonadetes bacterium]|nr:hypothetical protein [Akkermansiaceae bacterium]
MKHQTPITTDISNEALLSFISAAHAGKKDASTQQQKTAFRLASLLHELYFDLISLPDSEIEGFLALARLSTGRPVWDAQKIRVSLLIAAAVEPQDEPEPENHPATPDSLPLWKRMQIHQSKQAQLRAQLVDEISDPASVTIGSKTRKEFDAQFLR